MPQFLIGFWCGCASAALVVCLIYASKKRQVEEMRGRDPEDEETDASDAVSGFRVLLVDDSKLSRTVMKELLAKKHWTIFEAGSGVECLRLAKKYKFHLIFLDQHMPGMDGNETLQRLWIDGSIASDVPVVAVGSNIRKEHEKEYAEKGYAACLGKPFQANRMEEILSQVFKESEAKENEEKEERKEVSVPEGFSYQKGLEFFDGNETAYRETLVLFAELWEERREQLRQFLEEENMEEYAILIHAVKGDARTLGAEALGESAYEQELKAKQGDVQAIRSSFDRVIREGDQNAEFFRKKFS